MNTKNRTRISGTKYLFMFVVATIVTTAVGIPLLRPALSQNVTEVQLSAASIAMSQGFVKSNILYMLRGDGSIALFNTDEMAVEKEIETTFSDLASMIIVDPDPPSEETEGNHDVKGSPPSTLKEEASDTVVLLAKDGTVKLAQMDSPSAFQEISVFSSEREKTTEEKTEESLFLEQSGEKFFLITNLGKVYSFNLQGESFGQIADLALQDQQIPTTSEIFDGFLHVGTSTGEIITVNVQDQIFLTERYQLFDEHPNSITSNEEGLFISTLEGKTYIIKNPNDAERSSVVSEKLSSATYQDTLVLSSGESIILVANTNLLTKVQLDWALSEEDSDGERPDDSALPEIPSEDQSENTKEEESDENQLPVDNGPLPEGYGQDQLFAQVDENGIVVWVAVGGGVEFLKDAHGGNWIPTWDGKEGHNRAQIGMYWDGSNFQMPPSP
jgi:hypothetical protein